MTASLVGDAARRPTRRILKVLQAPDNPKDVT